MTNKEKPGLPGETEDGEKTETPYKPLLMQLKHLTS